MADLTTSNATNGTGLTKDKSDRLDEAEECLSGLAQPIADAVKLCEGSTPLVYPDPPDRFDIWTQMSYIVAILKDIHEYCDQTLPHDEEFTWRSLPGKVRLLSKAQSQIPSTGPNTTGPDQESLKEADRCLNGLMKPIHEAFKLAQGGTHYEPNAPEGDFDIWDIMKYIVDQLGAISKDCEKHAPANNAFKGASLADQVNSLIGSSKTKEGN